MSLVHRVFFFVAVGAALVLADTTACGGVRYSLNDSKGYLLELPPVDTSEEFGCTSRQFVAQLDDNKFYLIKVLGSDCRRLLKDGDGITIIPLVDEKQTDEDHNSGEADDVDKLKKVVDGLPLVWKTVVEDAKGNPVTIVRKSVRQVGCYWGYYTDDEKVFPVDSTSEEHDLTRTIPSGAPVIISSFPKKGRVTVILADPEVTVYDTVFDPITGFVEEHRHYMKKDQKDLFYMSLFQHRLISAQRITYMGRSLKVVLMENPDGKHITFIRHEPDSLPDPEPVVEVTNDGDTEVLPEKEDDTPVVVDDSAAPGRRLYARRGGHEGSLQRRAPYALDLRNVQVKGKSVTLFKTGKRPFIPLYLTFEEEAADVLRYTLTVRVDNMVSIIYRVNPDTRVVLTHSEMISTRMLPGPDMQDAEEMIIDTLGRLERIRVSPLGAIILETDNSQTHLIFYPTGQLIVERPPDLPEDLVKAMPVRKLQGTPLADHGFRGGLQSLVVDGKQALLMTKPILRLTPGYTGLSYRLSLQVFNYLLLEIVVDDNTGDITQKSPVMRTRMIGSTEIMNIEHQFMGILNNIVNIVRTDKETVTIKTHKEVLIFKEV